MIITRTPLRISLAGGGTDFKDFYLKKGGAVLSFGIDKYIYIIIKERFDDKIYINYSRKEIVNTVEEIEHDLIREAMKKTGVEKGVEITTLADIPSEGCGLGSSSSVIVGLLNALYAYNGIQITLATLAQQACEIEIEIHKRPIGIQDQYIAAFGNLRFFEFKTDGTIGVETLSITKEQKKILISNLLLFYTNKTRNSSTILLEQKQNIALRIDELCKIQSLAYEAKCCILDNNIDKIGILLDKGWTEKKKLASNITNIEIDQMYTRAKTAGALGGKISGAGAGGFLLLYCPLENQNAVRRILKEYRELSFLLSKDGSKVIFNIRE